MNRLTTAIVITLWLAPLISTASTTTDAPPKSCASRSLVAGRHYFERTLKCVAHPKRGAGAVPLACRNRARDAFFAEVSHVGCVADGSIPDTIETCVMNLTDEIPSGGRCATRKLMAARGAVGPLLQVERALRDGNGHSRSILTSLCRRFDQAGSCAGDCGRVRDDIAQCWAQLVPPTPPRSTCTLPAAAGDDQIVLFGAYEADAVSTVTLGSQDIETTTARVAIEPGTRGLYVVLSSYAATIWRFEGDTSRIHQVVLVGRQAQGVTGLPSNRIVDLTKPSSPTDAPCFEVFYDARSVEGVTARGAVERALSHAVDTFSADYAVGTLHLPAGTAEQSPRSELPAPAGFDPQVYAEATLFNPGGIVTVDTARVVSNSHAEPYQVLPHQFGLAQLVGSGALERHDRDFFLVRPIPRFPAELTGSHSVRLVLATGIPLPAGNPGHSCVVSEATGVPLVNAGLCSISNPPSTSCTLPAAAPQDRVILFGAYGGTAISTVTVAGQDETTTTSRVVIEPGATPLYLVLSSFKAMIWRFEGATSRVHQVVLVGVREQGVTGLPAARVVSRTKTVGSLTDAVCFAPFYDTQSVEGVVARGVVQRGLSRAIDTFAASYDVGTLRLPIGTVEADVVSPNHAPAGLDPSIYAGALRFSPGGIIDINPAQVVSPHAAEVYEVLPEHMGLAQLVGSGALEAHAGSFFGGDFFILRAIPRFPAGLAGSLAVRFVLGRGVPVPAGDPGHSCVVSEATGLPILNAQLCGLQ